MTSRGTPSDADAFNYYEGLAQSCSGEAVITPSVTARAMVLNGGKRPKGVTGLASVQVHVEDVPPLVDLTLIEPNMKMVLDLSWSSGRGGGSATVDVTRGACFTLGGADEISAVARFELQDTLGAFVAGNAKHISASIGWGGSISPRSARYTSTAVRLTAILGLTSAFIPIPAQASEVRILTQTPAANAALRLLFYSAQTAAPRAIYEDLDPTAEWIPVLHGAEFIQIIAAQSVTATPTWQLWL